MFRISSLLPASGAIVLGATVEAVAACGLFGEMLALVASTYRLKRCQAIPAREMLKSAIYVIVCLFAAGGIAWFGAHHWALWSVSFILSLLVLCAFTAARWLFPDCIRRLRNEVYSFLTRWPSSTVSSGCRALPYQARTTDPVICPAAAAPCRIKWSAGGAVVLRRAVSLTRGVSTQLRMPPLRVSTGARCRVVAEEEASHGPR